MTNKQVFHNGLIIIILNHLWEGNMFYHEKKKLEYWYQEYNLLRKTMEQARIIFHARMLVFVTICSFSLSKIFKAFLPNNRIISTTYFFLLLILLAIGYSTYISILDHHVTITNYMKKLNKTRGKITSSIKIDDPILSTSERHPPFGYFGFSNRKNFIKGYPFIIAIINSTFVSILPILGSFAFSDIFNDSTQELSLTQIFTFVFAGLLFILSLVYHALKRCEILRTAEKNYIISHSNASEDM